MQSRTTPSGFELSNHGMSHPIGYAPQPKTPNAEIANALCAVASSAHNSVSCSISEEQCALTKDQRIYR